MPFIGKILKIIRLNKLAIDKQLDSGLPTPVAGQVLVLGDPRRSAETLGGLPVALTDEHLTQVVSAWR